VVIAVAVVNQNVLSLKGTSEACVLPCLFNYLVVLLLFAWGLSS